MTEEVYESQIFILGKKVEAFETDFAAYCHTKRAVGVSSGTDALLIALMVLGILATAVVARFERAISPWRNPA